MNQLKGLNKSGLSFVQQKRSDDKKDRGEVSTHSRIFGSDRIESVAEVLEDKVNDEDGRKVSIPGGIPLGINSVSSGSPPPLPQNSTGGSTRLQEVQQGGREGREGRTESMKGVESESKEGSVKRV